MDDEYQCAPCPSFSFLPTHLLPFPPFLLSPDEKTFTLWLFFFDPRLSGCFAFFFLRLRLLFCFSFHGYTYDTTALSNIKSNFVAHQKKSSSISSIFIHDGVSLGYNSK